MDRPTDRQRDIDRDKQTSPSFHHKMKFLRTISNERGVHRRQLYRTLTTLSLYFSFSYKAKKVPHRLTPGRHEADRVLSRTVGERTRNQQMQTSKCKSEKGGRGQRCHTKGRSKGQQDKATWSVGDGEAGRRKANPGGSVTESPARTSLLSPTPLKSLQLNPQTEQQLAWLLPFLPMPH